MEIQEAIAIIQEKEGLHGQEEVAKHLKVSQPTISNYMAGRSQPTLSVAAMIYGMYGIQCEPFTKKALQKELDFLNKVKS